MLSVGIVGLPNVGKSTVFNALCRGGAKVSNYAFCTIEPNRAVVSVPDPRLDTVARLFEQDRAVPASIEFVDIAGLVRGASEGEGLGNQFLAAIREADAILHIVRCFPDGEIAHVEGDVDPVRDVEIVETELLLADLAAIERRREKIAPDVKGGEKDAVREAEALEALARHLDSGSPARTAPDRADIRAGTQLFLLTDKPEVHVANVGEDDQASLAAARRLEERAAAPVVRLTGKLEADLAEMDDEERAAFMAELDLTTSGLERVIRACYEALGLVTFFTGVGAEARAWAVPEGTAVAAAAGRIHSDMERGFVRAEVIPFPLLAEVGSWQEAHRAGRVRTEGRDYHVQEGDVLLVRFNP
jgi:GTP-binding protein YchF